MSSREQSPHATAPDRDRLTSLLRRIVDGDQQAFAMLYDELAPAVFGIVRNVLRDAAMSEEVTQEVFVDLWRQAKRYDPSKASPRTWACTIAHRKAVDRVRSEQARRRREDRDHQSSVMVAADTVTEVIERQETRGEVRAALASLSPAQREAVTLAYFEGRTYRDVATLLSIPEGTAKTRIRDGLQKLRTRMGREL